MVAVAFGSPFGERRVAAAPSLIPSYDRRRSPSDTRYVGGDKKHASVAMQHTAGMEDPSRTMFWLEKLTEAEHRGRHDTWTAARDRAAEKAGAPVSRVKRLWDRWRTMKEVAGSVMIPLMLAYEDLCERVEAKADEYESRNLQQGDIKDAVVEGPVPAGTGMVALAPRGDRDAR